MIDLEICKSSLDHEKEGRGGLVKVKAVAQVHLFAIFYMNCNSIIYMYIYIYIYIYIYVYVLQY